VLGACLALSSTAIVMQLLTEQGRFGTPVGRASFAILLAQDIAVVPILFLVGALGASGDEGLLGALLIALGKAVAAVLLILGMGRLVIRPLFRFVGSVHSRELFIAATLLIVIATSATTHAVGLSAALGAFLAGLLFAETEFRHEIEVDIEPFKGLLLGLFFMSIGMIIDVAAILAEPLWIPLSVIGLFVIKAAVVGLVAGPFGFSRAQVIETGLLLGEGGEFAFVVVGLAMSYDMLPEAVQQFMLVVVAATMFLTPVVARLARDLGRRLEQAHDADEDARIELPADLSGHVVLAGFGRTGELLARILDAQRIAYVAYDVDAARVARYRAAGQPVYRGDVSRPALIERARIDQAAALVVTTDDPAAAERVVAAARAHAPELPIVARARDGEHAARLLEQHATQVVLEVREVGLEMGRMLLEHTGMPADAARDLIAALRLEGK
jgi:CPA2 family monovalent cation:H+ antiporter-2